MSIHHRRRTGFSTGSFLLTVIAAAACGEADPLTPRASPSHPSHVQRPSYPATYSIRELPSLPGTDECWANDINNSGTVVGGCRTVGEEVDFVQGIVWTNGTFHVLPSLGGYETVAGAISNRGQIVGTSRTPDGTAHAVLWSDFESIQDLGGVPYAIGSTAYDINNRGQVAITSCTTLFDCRGLIWDNGSLTDLGDLGGGTTVASAINARGQVVGHSYLGADGPYHAFVWQDGAMRDLETLGGDLSWAMGVNDGGEIVGWSTISTTQTRAFVWRHGEMSELSVSGADFSRAHDVNESGVIVGISQVTGASFNARVWLGDQTIDLGIWNTQSDATGVNARGQIVGSAVAPDWSQWKAVVWER